MLQGLMSVFPVVANMVTVPHDANLQIVSPPVLPEISLKMLTLYGSATWAAQLSIGSLPVTAV